MPRPRDLAPAAMKLAAPVRPTPPDARLTAADLGAGRRSAAWLGDGITAKSPAASVMLIAAIAIEHAALHEFRRVTSWQSPVACARVLVSRHRYSFVAMREAAKQPAGTR